MAHVVDRYARPDLLQDFVRDPFACLLALSPRGRLVPFRLGNAACYLVADPGLAADVLRDHERFPKGPSEGSLGLAYAVGEGPITSSGERWRALRALVQPDYAVTRQESAPARLRPAIERMVVSWDQSARRGEPIDLLAEMRRLTLHAVLAEFLQTDDFDGFDTLLSIVSGVEDRMSIGGQFMLASMPRAQVDTLRNSPAMRTAREQLDDVLERLIAWCEPHPDTFVARTLASPALAAAAPDAPRRLLRDLIATTLFAGTGTTSSEAFWAIDALHRSPADLARLRADLGTPDLDRIHTAGTRGTFPFLDACIQEALRLYPAVWYFDRLVPEPCDLDGIPLPAGAVLGISPFALHRRADDWTDPERFDPARFLDAGGGTRVRAFMPFGHGPRYCAGASFAQQLLAMTVAALVSRYDLAFPPNRVVTFARAAVLSPAERVLVQATIRQAPTPLTAAGAVR